MIRKSNLKPGSTQRERSRFSILDLPIRQRLPLLIGTLLFFVITIATWACYRGVKDSAFEIARERLLSLTQQLANQSQQSIPNLLNRTFTVANEPPIRAFLKTPSNTTRTEALAALKQFTAPQDPNSVQVELWNSDGSLVLSAPEEPGPMPADLQADFQQCANDPFRTPGAIRIVRGNAAYPALAATKDDSGKAIGYLVRWRRFSPTANARKQTADLLGSQAALYYGNTRGDVWTDLEMPVSMPTTLASTLDVIHYARDGNSVMALGRPINGTPWSVVVEFPDEVFLGQANRFLRRMLLIDFGLLAVGIIAAGLLSQSITGPLHALTEASSAISAGDYTRRVDIHRHDELGALAEAFNTMVGKLRESQRELRLQSAALESAANGIMITDANGKILWVNPAFTKITGYTPEDAIGQTPRLLKSGKQNGEFYKEMWDTILSGKMWRNTIINRWKDGTLAHEDLMITPITNGSGEITNFVAIKQDITERIRSQEALTAKNEELTMMTQQLWQASKLATMGELAASIAHELNNPLATVALRTELISDQLPEGDGARTSAQIVLNEVERMAQLVNNLLQFSRRRHRQISTVDAAEEISNSVNFISYYLRNRKVENLSEFAVDAPAIQADRQQLRQVFLNLLTNAADAMPNGGTLTTRTTATELGGEKAVQVEFIDTGIGIARENLDRVWDSFFTTKPEGKGTGLGLAICRRVVEEHGGMIEIQSEVGHGTNVRMVLPITANSRDNGARALALDFNEPGTS